MGSLVSGQIFLLLLSSRGERVDGRGEGSPYF